MSPAAKLTRGPIAPTLSGLAIPTFFGIITILSFNLVDTYFVGLLGTIPLAAISFTLPVAFTVMNLAMGLGIGTSASLARLIGSGRIEEARRFTTHALLLSVVLVVALAICGILTIDSLFKALGAEAHLLPIIRDFMTIWYAGVGFLVIPMVGNAAIRATGDTRTPSKIMAVAGVMNGIFDPILIFGWGPFPELGVKGAAIATVIAWMFSCAASIWILYYREKLLDLSFPKMGELIESWKP
ncbi:MAG TPA: MATE family efflux transporter, partial [Pseudomonadales bacterium]|nr:MATE family efflux transporter [Pseudomonadales bacterium]